MADPTTNTVGGIATGAITLTGSIFGLQFDALLLALFGGLVSLMHLPRMTAARMAGTLATAAVLGAAFAPLAGAAGLNYLPWLKTVGPDILRLAAALAIGVVAQVGIPMLFAFLRRKAGGEA